MAVEFPITGGYGQEAVDTPSVVLTESGAVMFKLPTAPPPDEEILPGYMTFYWNPVGEKLMVRGNVARSGEILETELLED